MKLPASEANELKEKLLDSIKNEEFLQAVLSGRYIPSADILAICKDHDTLTMQNFQLKLQLTDYSRRALQLAKITRQLLPDPKAISEAIEQADQMIELVDPSWALMKRSERENE